jgi:miniconductance mechanosensitive channel
MAMLSLFDLVAYQRDGHLGYLSNAMEISQSEQD